MYGSRMGVISVSDQPNQSSVEVKVELSYICLPCVCLMVCTETGLPLFYVTGTLRLFE